MHPAPWKAGCGWILTYQGRSRRGICTPLISPCCLATESLRSSCRLRLGHAVLRWWHVHPEHEHWFPLLPIRGAI